MMKSLYSLYIFGVLEIEVPSKYSLKAVFSVSWISSHANHPVKTTPVRLEFQQLGFWRERELTGRAWDGVEFEF